MKRTNKKSFKAVETICHHWTWVPTPLAPELYEQCYNCGLKRYRDTVKREKKIIGEQLLGEQQLKLF